MSEFREFRAGDVIAPKSRLSDNDNVKMILQTGEGFIYYCFVNLSPARTTTRIYAREQRSIHWFNEIVK